MADPDALTMLELLTGKPAMNEITVVQLFTPPLDVACEWRSLERIEVV